MPNIFRARQTLLWASIFALVAFSLMSCAKGKGTSSESLYSEIKAVQGGAYTVLVQEYIGTSPLYVHCESRLIEGGHAEHAAPRLSTNCATEVQTFVYSALIPVERDGQYYYLPLQIRSYEPIQLSEYVTETIGNVEYSKVAVEARQDISQVRSYRGSSDFVFLVPGYESATEEHSHFPNPGEGNDDRP